MIDLDKLPGMVERLRADADASRELHHRASQALAIAEARSVAHRVLLAALARRARLDAAALYGLRGAAGALFASHPQDAAMLAEFDALIALVESASS